MFQKLKIKAGRLIARRVPGLLHAIQQYELSQIRKRPGTVLPGDFRLGDGSAFHLYGEYSALRVGKAVSFRKYCNILLFPNATLSIADNVFFNNYCSLNCLESIEIGEGTLFGEGVKIYDHNHRYEYDAVNGQDIKAGEFTKGRVRIGKKCWIGSNVTILKNVEIGDNVVVGAHCLIYRSIPANSMVKHGESLIITQS